MTRTNCIKCKCIERCFRASGSTHLLLLLHRWQRYNWLWYPNWSSKEELTERFLHYTCIENLEHRIWITKLDYPRKIQIIEVTFIVSDSLTRTKIQSNLESHFFFTQQLRYEKVSFRKCRLNTNTIVVVTVKYCSRTIRIGIECLSVLVVDINRSKKVNKNVRSVCSYFFYFSNHWCVNHVPSI
jgi:hypothetical protein